MANVCLFNAKLVGKKENCEKFLDALQQKGTEYMGRGAYITSCESEELEDSKVAYEMFGECKWSIHSALIDNAISMRKDVDKWYFGEDVDKNSLTFIALDEAVEKYNVDFEVYSEEPACQFAEHFLFENGEQIDDKIVKYFEICKDFYESKESAEEEIGEKISDDEWENCDIIIRGGFGECPEFNI